MATSPFAPQSVVLVDPVSSGKHLKSYVKEAGYSLIALFTLTDEQLAAAGKPLPRELKLQHCDHVLETRDFEEALRFIRSTGLPVAAVIAASEPGVELADWLAAKLGVVGNSPETSELRRNKFAARSAVRAEGLSGPDFALCATPEDVLAFCRKPRPETTPWPIVLKTPKGAGSHQVFFCYSEEEAQRAFEDIVSQPNLFGGLTRVALAEEYITGPHYVVELLADGRDQHFTSLWQFHFGSNRHGRVDFERAHLIQDPLELERLATVITFAKRAAKATGIQYGPSLTEIRLDPVRGPQMIEIGARLSGIELPTVMRRVSSFDPYAATLEVFVQGTRYRMPPVHFKERVNFLFCKAKGSGIVESVDGLEELKALPSYFMSQVFTKPGDQIADARDLASIPLYLYLCHQDENVLARDSKRADEVFKVRFQEAPPRLLPPPL